MADIRWFDGVLGASAVLARVVAVRFAGTVSVSETVISSSSSSDVGCCVLM